MARPHNRKPVTASTIRRVTYLLHKGERQYAVANSLGISIKTVGKIARGEILAEDRMDPTPPPRLELVSVQPVQEAQTGRSYSLAPRRSA